ncbi:hypothetical protein SCP_0109210 [Sparassis crispa]|uniref:Uncharacterized protein n=1 Tax=Sparassis crispa TaxID=139825 RepID=A0A401G7B5_9APHY|nr:hypothetical protein SCP_0109210 [Sparassis crispa]GBE78039.1 hypothetical protein SCP_0109210 [Sparassis crispa]
MSQAEISQPLGHVNTSPAHELSSSEICEPEDTTTLRACTPDTQDVMDHITAYIGYTTPAASPARTAFTTVPSSSPYSILTSPSGLWKQREVSASPPLGSPCARGVTPPIEAPLPMLFTPSTHIPVLPRLFPSPSGTSASRGVYKVAARARYPDLDSPSSRYWNYITFSQEVSYRDFTFDIDGSEAAKIAE